MAYESISYCKDCYSIIKELNQVLREGPTEVKLFYPYAPEDKFLYAFMSGDYGCRFFTGKPTRVGPNSIPIEILHRAPVLDSEPKDTILGKEYFIYFLLNTQKWSIKIGRTKNLKQRLTFYDRYSTSLLGVLAAQERTVETTLHKRFNHLSLGNEWFSPAEDLLKFIAQQVDTPCKFL